MTLSYSVGSSIGNSVGTQFAPSLQNGPRASPFLRYHFGVAAGPLGNGVLGPLGGISK